MTMPLPGSAHLLRDFTEERFGQSLSDSDSESKGDAAEPEMLKERRRPAQFCRECLHQILHVISFLIIFILAVRFWRYGGLWSKACVERQSTYCSSNYSLTVSLAMKSSSLLIPVHQLLC